MTARLKGPAGSPFWDSPRRAELAAEIIQNGKFDSLRDAARREGEPAWRVLRYGRVIDPEKLGYPLPVNNFVTPDTFRVHLRTLKQTCNVISLAHLIKHLQAGDEVPPNAVCITLDGGWVDHFVYAGPVLRDENVPFTIFVPTAFIGTKEYFWQDKFLLGMLALQRKGIRFTPFPFLSAEIRTRIEEESPDGEISTASILLLLVGLQGARPEERSAALKRLGEIVMQVGFGEPIEPAFARWEDLEVLERALPVTFGVLGHRHLNYSEITPEQAAADLIESLTTLASRLKNGLGLFAFPYGIATQPGIAAFERVGGEFAFNLGAESTPIPLNDGNVTLIPRVSIYEGCSFTPELLACRVWSIFE